MDTDIENRGKARRVYVLAAWGSPLAGAVASVVLWQWIVNHSGVRGERPPGALLFDLLLLAMSVAGGLAGLLSLLGIRSWRSALVILPGALLGVCVNTGCALYALLAFAYEGVNPAG
jgi:hypothetical protein